ncbi:MAG: GTP 3',8-cyclase MoaA [Aquificaceae bacterium]|nr:GTP 3',8-cyclase MoaA [Aquificaceae bacterium]MDW8237682.1 GTP 3',8-cyclase MoaA [Aquificaceae bacterium]
MGELKDSFLRPLKTLRLSVTDRCNLRCTFCMPDGQNYEFFKRSEILTFEEIQRIVRILTNLGVRKVKLTGGEPLLRKDLEKLIEKLSSLDLKEITLTTNGTGFVKKAQELKRAGLKRVTFSLHSLKEDVLKKLSGRDLKLSEVLRAIDKAKELNFDPVKINVCLIKGINDREAVDFVKFFKNWGVVIRFIEFMDVGTLNGWSEELVVSSKELINEFKNHFEVLPLGERKSGEVSYAYLIDGQRVEFISSISEPFCLDCNRLRLSADGKLFTCLYASEGFDVKKLLRSNKTDLEISNAIENLWRSRTDRYSLERLKRKDQKRMEMFTLGG